MRNPVDEVEESALRWEIYASLQNVLDAVAMIVADLGLRKPSSYSELGHPLFETGLIDEAERELIVRVAKTRNLLAHAYRRISQRDLGQVVDELLPAVEGLVHKLIALCDEKGVDPPSGQFAKLKQVFEKHGVALAYLFGSRAKGTAREDSDYDIAVLFEKQAGILDEVELAVDISKELGIPPERVDVVSLNNADVMLKARVLKEGVPIYAKDDGLRGEWERRTYVELLDELDLQALYIRRALRVRPRRDSGR